MNDNSISEKVLNTPMQPNDADAATIRGYLIALLAKVWAEGECFNGKRPFGNSSWECEIYEALVRAELIEGVLDEGGLADCDTDAADCLIVDAITTWGEI